MRLSPSLRTYALEARSAFVHAPIEVVMGVLLAVTFSIAVREIGGEQWWSRIAIGVGLAMPIVFGLSLMRARRAVPAATTWLATALALLGVAVYALWIFDPELAGERWRWVALAAAAWLALLCVPAVGGGAREAVRHRVWSFAIGLLARLAGVLAYGVVLYGAMAGAVAAVTNLFELTTPEHLYADLAGLVFFALVPWVVAGGVPTLAMSGEERASAGHLPIQELHDRSLIASRIGRFLYVPVLGIYLLILYAYTVKVLATGELPRNLLSPIILFAGLAGFIGGVLLEPLQRRREPPGVSTMVRLFPVLLLPLLPLAIWAVGLRLAQHGWTEFRYLRFALLLTLLLLAVAGTVRFLRRRAPLLVAVPATLALVLFLSSVGPWSAQAVSRRDQQERLRTALAEAGMLSEGDGVQVPDSTASPRRLPADQFERISGGITYLYNAHGAGAVRSIISAADDFDNGWEMVRALRIEAGCEPGDVQHVSAALPYTLGVELPSGTLYRLTASSNDRAMPPGTQDAAVRMRVEGAGLVVSSEPPEAWSAGVDLAPLVERLASTAPDGCGPQRRPEPPRLTAADATHRLIDAAGAERGALVLTMLGIRWDSTAAALMVEHAEALVVVR